MGEISWLDYVLLPFYLLLIFKVALYYRDKYYPENHSWRAYFIPALTAKIVGALFIGLVYNYYYGGGDTFNFFFHAQLINNTLIESPATWFRLMTHQADTGNMHDAMALSEMYWYDDTSSYTTSCLGALIGIFCFTKYLVINAFVACLSFTGTWLMFATFARQYPQLVKPIAIALLFIPGPIVWGSGLFKDSFCLFAVGSLVYCADILLDKRQFRAVETGLLLLCLALLVFIKAYILIALLPALLLKTFLLYTRKAWVNPLVRKHYFIGLGITVVVGLIIIQKATSYLSLTTLQLMLDTIKHQKDYLLQVSLDAQGSTYDLGDFDPTIGSLLGKFWPAVNVTLFRPYVWEAGNVLQLFDALQSAAVLLLTAYVVLKRNLLKTLKYLFTDPNLIMCLLFTLLFAFLVGVSTYNFGSLSRYKIPCTPFYLLLLLILLYYDKPANAEDGAASKATEPHITPPAA